MNRKKMSEWLYRALRTFGQAAAGYIAANIVRLSITDSEAVKTVVASAVAAGIAAVMNADWNHVE